MKRFLPLSLMSLVATAAMARSPKLASDLVPPRGSSPIDVIVQYKTTMTTAHHHRLQAKGGRFRKSLGLVHGAAYSLPYSALEALAADPDVVYISPDRPVKANLDYATAAPQINGAWTSYGLDGKGIGVAERCVRARHARGGHPRR